MNNFQMASPVTPKVKPGGRRQDPEQLVHLHDSLGNALYSNRNCPWIVAAKDVPTIPFTASHFTQEQCAIAHTEELWPELVEITYEQLVAVCDNKRASAYTPSRYQQYQPQQMSGNSRHNMEPNNMLEMRVMQLEMQLANINQEYERMRLAFSPRRNF